MEHLNESDTYLWVDREKVEKYFYCIKISAQDNSNAIWPCFGGSIFPFSCDRKKAYKCGRYSLVVLPQTSSPNLQGIKHEYSEYGKGFFQTKSLVGLGVPVADIVSCPSAYVSYEYDS